MIMFCKDLKEQAMKIINYEKKKIIPLTDKEKETHENQKVCYIRKKEFSTDKKYCKVIIQDSIEELLIVFVI